MLTSFRKPRKSFSRRKSLLLLPLLALAMGAWADDDVPASPLRFSGFATLGMTHNDNAQVGAIYSSAQRHPANKGWSPNLDTVVGLQADWQIQDGTSVTVQGVARAGNDGDPELRMAYVRQQLTNETALRVGRIRSPLFFDSDVSEIGYAYMMVRPPMVLYGTMNSVAGLDGGDLQWRHSFGDVAVMLQGYYGNYGYKHRFYNLSPVAEADAQLDNIRGLAITASLPKVTMRVSRTWVDRYSMRSAQVSQVNSGLGQVSSGLLLAAQNPFLPPAMAAGLTNEANQIAGLKNPFDNKPIYTSVGFDSTLDNWRLLGEWTQLDSQSRMVGKYEGFHLTTGYSLGDFTPYVSVARYERKSKALDTSAFVATGMDPTLDAAIAQMKAGLDQSAQYANLSTRSISYGVRWDLRDNMALKVQYDRMTTPNAMVPGYFAVKSLPIDNKVNLLTVALDMVF
ncbi:MAG TPA: hypothetical protein VFW68_04120 [Rhodocyclaceae bacterium]|nr:hypothetical protein [Rhodocyclaceae bacterium]